MEIKLICEECGYPIEDHICPDMNGDKLHNEKMPIDEWGEETGLKQSLETHLEYGDDIVRLALITFREYLQKNYK